MTPEKQRLYDAFIAGMAAAHDEANLGAPIIGYRSRGRFEEWLDEQDVQAESQVVSQKNEEMRRLLLRPRTIGDHE